MKRLNGVACGLLFVFVVYLPAMAQTPDTLWSKTRGDAEADITGHAIAKLPGGGYVVGLTRLASGGEPQLCLWRVSEWGRTTGFCTLNSGIDFRVASIDAINESSYFVTGVSQDSSGWWWVVALNADDNGSTLWEYRDGPFAGAGAHGCQLTDGGFALSVISDTGDYYHHPAIQILNADGTARARWQPDLPPGTDWIVRKVHPTADGGICAVGNRWPFPDPMRVWVAEFDANGSLLWERYELHATMDQGMDVLPLGAGRVIVSAMTSSNDIWLMKLPSSGEIIWETIIDVPTLFTPLCLRRTQDGGFVMGSGRNSGANTQALVYKFDSNGQELWEHSFGGPHGDYLSDMVIADDGEIVFAGTSHDDDFRALALKTGNPPLATDPELLEFFEVVEDHQRSLQIEITNVSDSDLTIMQFVMSTGFEITWPGGSIGLSPGFGMSFAVTFSPMLVGEYADDMQIVLLDGPTVLVPMHGIGVVDPGMEWQRFYGGPYSEKCNALAKWTGDGYLLAGSMESWAYGQADMWLVRTDGEGQQRWTRRFGGANTEECRAMIITSGNHIALAGHTNTESAGSTDFWLIETDSLGHELWSQRYGGAQSDQCNAIVESLHGGFLLAGKTASYGAGGYDVWLVRVDEDGDTLWTKTVGGVTADGCQGANSHDGCEALVELDDGSIVMAGWTTSFELQISDALLIKVAANGDSVWNATFGGTGHDSLFALIKTSDGALLAGGYSRSIWGDRQLWISKWGTGGRMMWERKYGGADDEDCRTLLETPEGHFLVAGSTMSNSEGRNDGWLLEIDADGDSLWSRNFGGYNPDYATGVVQTVDGGMTIAGTTQSYGEGSHDFWLLRVSDNLTPIGEPDHAAPRAFTLAQNYPNPFNASTTIEFTLEHATHASLRVFDLLGREVAQLARGEYAAGAHQVTFDATNLASGIYFYKIETNENSMNRKMVILR